MSKRWCPSSWKYWCWEAAVFISKRLLYLPVVSGMGWIKKQIYCYACHWIPLENTTLRNFTKVFLSCEPWNGHSFEIDIPYIGWNQLSAGPKSFELAPLIGWYWHYISEVGISSSIWSKLASETSNACRLQHFLMSCVLSYRVEHPERRREIPCSHAPVYCYLFISKVNLPR